MNTQYAFWRSGTFWTVVLMFIIGGFQNISSLMPSGIATVVLGALGILATYLHVSIANKLGARN